MRSEFTATRPTHNWQCCAAQQPETDGMPTIVGVDTSTTAFVGRSRSGPVGSPKLIFTFAEFTNGFGGLWSESPMTLAVQQFFDNGGSKALIVRASASDP